MIKREAVYGGLGRSRKRIMAYRVPGITVAQQARHAAYSQMKKRLEAEGIDFIVYPDIHIQRYPWGIGVDLCIPVEVRNTADLGALAGLAKRLVRRETSIVQAFPSYQYDMDDWLGDWAR
ncbi:MAG: hypothetical protein QM739_07610 [Propionivibrio sp.]